MSRGMPEECAEAAGLFDFIDEQRDRSGPIDPGIRAAYATPGWSWALREVEALRQERVIRANIAEAVIACCTGCDAIGRPLPDGGSCLGQAVLAKLLETPLSEPIVNIIPEGSGGITDAM